MPTNYTFNGSEGAPISLKDAKDWAANYRAKFPNETKAHFFGFEIIQKILAENGCMGIRIYYAISDKGEKQLILAGADANGDNLLPAEAKLDAGDPNILGDASYPCPSFCAGNDL